MNENKPTLKTKLGNVALSVWKNETEGRTYLNTTLENQYRDKDGNYQDAKSYSEVDLLCLKSCIEEALAAIRKQRAS